MSRKTLIITAAILGALIVAAGGYEMGSSNNKAKNSTAPKTTATTVSAKAVNPVVTNNKLIFTELGVQITVPDELKGMKYVAIDPPAEFKSTPTALFLTLSTYSDAANKCMGTSSDTSQHFAGLTRSNSGSGPGGPEIIKQFSGFYVGNLGASVPKGTQCKDAADQASFDSLSASLNSALKTAFSTATEVK